MRPVVVAGPTAVGKTRLAVSLAKELNAQIISVDSRQVYRYMDIGTAKPDRADLEAVSHHLIDFLAPDAHYSAGSFGRDARQVVTELSEAGTRAILVGGSGLYLSAYVDGLFEAGQGDFSPARKLLRERLESEGLSALYRELGELDPRTQLTLEANDEQRILRALELVPAGGKRQLAEGPHPSLGRAPLMICLSMERQLLYDRIERRVDTMVEAGWVEEVENLLDRGFDERATGMKSLGYEEILSTLRGSISLEVAVESIKRRSRQYAKRQLTWFRKDRRLRWLDVAQLGKEGVLERIMTQLATADA